MNVSKRARISAPPTPLRRHAPTIYVLLILFLGHITNIQAEMRPRLGWVGTDLRGLECDGPPPNIGPFDYTNPIHRRNNLPIVEEYHFNKKIRLLQTGGRSMGSAEGDIIYTLMAFPNHYLALQSLMNVEFVLKKKFNPPMICFFNRAIAFKPNDYKVHMLKGVYLRHKKLYNASLKAFATAEKIKKNPPDLLYNIGLLYFDMKKYDKAAQYAKRAYHEGYKNEGLRKALKKKGFKV